MSSPARRPNYTPRRKREQRAYLATMVGGTAALVSVVTAVLALITSFTWTIPILAAIVAVIAYFVFKGANGKALVRLLLLDDEHGARGVMRDRRADAAQQVPVDADARVRGPGRARRAVARGLETPPVSTSQDRGPRRGLPHERVSFL